MRITNIPSTSSKVKWKRRSWGGKKKKKKIGEAVGGQCAIYRERNGPGNELPCQNTEVERRGGRGKGSRAGRKSVAALLETRPFNATADDCQRNWIIPLRNFTSFHVILRRINRKDWSTNNLRKKKQREEKEKKRNTYSFTSKHFDPRIMRFLKRGACTNPPLYRIFNSINSSVPTSSRYLSYVLRWYFGSPRYEARFYRV